MEQIRLLEAKLADLKVEYDKYFSGVEKIEPTKLKGEVQKIVRRLSTLYINNTAIRFRKDNIIAQYNSYNQYWNRILRQIEEGTYVRDIFKADYRDRLKSINSQTGRPPSEGGGMPGGRAARPSGSGPREFEGVFSSLIKTKERLGESTVNIDYNVLSSNLKKQSDAIMKKYKVSRVDFTVEEKDGKAIIKALPKK
ncbi:MAG: hypothetical protein JW984_10190 [Deltaproteobacteria bacterium]|uniref:Uncharacterized protein n=1 Tax=Candidatus Zymogenus saltonus TaxID=2844893 RepID=A0A9D8KG44_9DELT|nr:hypothetical protein [Candidatus Zymogenus saltonus]